MTTTSRSTSVDEAAVITPTATPNATTAPAGARFATVPARVLIGVIGVALGAAAAMVTTPWILLAWLTPDLSLLGAFDKEERGILKPSAVGRYNATHSMIGPLVVSVIGAVALLGTSWVLAFGLLWFSHVLVDRACGYGLRTADGRQRG